MKHRSAQFEIPIKDEPFRLVGDRMKQSEPEKPKEKPDTGTMEMFDEAANN